jgi:hypothetical protein
MANRNAVNRTEDAPLIKEIEHYFHTIAQTALHTTDLIEIRAFRPGSGTACGLFTNLHLAAEAAVVLSRGGYNVYYPLNPISPTSEYAKKNPRSINTVDWHAFGSANACDISRRRAYLFDFDAARPAEFSKSPSTDQEQIETEVQAESFIEFMTEQGWPSPLTIDSGNGTHVVYLATDDTPANSANCERLKRVLRFLKTKFPLLDTTVYDAPRLHRVPGTVNRRGPSTIERPHRRSKVLNYPDPLIAVPAAKLLELDFLADPEAAYQGDQPKRKSKLPALAIDEAGVEDFCDEFPDQLSIREIKRKEGVVFFTLDFCPFKGGEHSNQEADKSAIILSKDNIGFRCFSSACEDNNFPALLALLYEETGRRPTTQFRVGMTDEECQQKWGCTVDDVAQQEKEAREAAYATEVIQFNQETNIFYGPTKLTDEFKRHLAHHEVLLTDAGRKEDLANLRSVARDVVAQADHATMLHYLHQFKGAYVGIEMTEPTWAQPEAQPEAQP